MILSLKIATKYLHVVAIAVSLPSLTNCRPTPSRDGDQSFGSNGSFTLKGSYGTLAYEGAALRSTEGEQCVVRISNLRLTFVPDAWTNRTSVIAAIQLRLVATKKPASGSGPFDILAEAEHPLSFTLSSESKTISVTDIELSLPSAEVFRSDHLGLAVTDGKLLWPIGGELKQP